MERVCLRRFSSFSLFAGLVFGLVGCGGGGSPSMPSGSQPTSLSGAVDSVVKAAMQQQGIPGMTVALAKNGSMLYVQAYGLSDIATHLATQPDTIFQIGSI